VDSEPLNFMNRKEEFAAQLHRDDLRTVSELLNNPDKEAIKQFYFEHFDEIVDLISKCRNLRSVIEDFYALAPELQSLLSVDNLFVYMVNTAIQNGVLTKDCFKAL